MRCYSKQCINNYQLFSWTINAVSTTFEAKKSINLISKSGCPILHALKSISSILKRQPLFLGSTRMSVYHIKVRKRAKIRNRYNQAPHLTQGTNGKVTTSQLDITNESQEVSPFNISRSRSFLIKINDILKNNILASIVNRLLWCSASRSSLLYSSFRYAIKLLSQPYKIQLYNFRVQRLAFFLTWFPD